MTTFAAGIRIDHADTGHVHFALFVGREGQTRAKAGDLILTPDEFWWLLATFVGRTVEVSGLGLGVVRPPSGSIEHSRHSGGAVTYDHDHPERTYVLPDGLVSSRVTAP